MSRAPVFLLALLSACASGQADQVSAPSPLTVRVASVGTAPAPAARTLHGLTRAADEATAGFAVGGRVAAVTVDLGDVVSAGQPLARLDARPLAAGVAALSGQLAELEQQEAQLARDVARLEALSETRAVSTQQLEQLTTQHGAVLAGIQSVEGRLSEARWAQEQAVLRSPLDGVITAELIRQGEVVGAGQPAFALRGQEGVEVELMLPSRMLSAVAAGDGVAVHFPLAGLSSRTGTVRAVAGAAAPGGLFPVTVTLPPSPELRPGLAVSVDLAAARTGGDGLAVPLAALVSPAGDETAVSRVSDGVVQTVPVEILDVIDDTVSVRGALAVGDMVVVRGQVGLTEGAAVEVVR